MRFIYSLIFAITISIGASGSNSRSLEWFIATSMGKTVPDFKGSVHFENQVLPLFSESQTVDSPASAFHVKLVYPVFEKLNSEELLQLRNDLNDITDSIQVKISLGMERKKQILGLSFYPFIKKGNTYYKLISFNWDVKPVGSVLRSASVLNRSASAIATSVLNAGKWQKISVTESGMYKLTYSDIKGMGINPDKVQIYGYGGALLEEDFSLGGYVDDLPEVAVWKDLGSDGVFNSGDFILFYAKGPLSWKYNAASSLFTRVRNHYSNKAYYFVGERAEGTKTVGKSTFEGASNVEVTSFTDLKLHESDLINIGESVASSGTGRQLYGEDFTASPSRAFSFDVANPDTTQTSRVQIDFIAKNTGTSNCAVYYNNSWLTNMSIPSVSSADDYKYASLSSKVASFTPKGKSISFRVDYQKNGSSITHRACLDFIALNVRCFLKMSGSSLIFRDPKSVGEGRVGRYTIQNAGSKPVVFDVSTPGDMVQMGGTTNGSDFIFKASASSLHEYVCADLNGTFSKPKIEGNVPNQNIHGYSKVDMVIIAPTEFASYANTLAIAHESHDNLSVIVVSPEEVYNEFSSGTPDATAYRRMMKYFYDKATTDQDLPKFLLLFGDGVFDNRMVSTTFSKVTSNPNKILTYESVESLEGTYSYVTDDYFGFLDDNEGANLPSDKMDIGIGRFPVSSEEQAKVAVEKTISYMKNARKGVWKNRLLFLADDGNEHEHTENADALAKTVALAHPEFMINKIYIDAYPKVTTVSGSTVPDANNRFSELLNSGLLMVNYTGHGSTTQWAEEKLLTMGDINAMSNSCLPLWVTATCDFTRFDSPDVSAGESIFLNPNGGGVALFSTTRVVYSTNNKWLNTSFIDHIFTKKDGIRYTLGEIMNKSKCSESLNGDANKLKFTLIGDPALKLAYPEYSAEITSIDGKDISNSLDTIHALSKVTVSGKINREDGTWAQGFNGVVSPTVLDAENVLTTWKDDLYSNATTIFERSKVLFSGKDSVQNGLFNFTFIVPKDISYSSKAGRINLYASDVSGLNEAQGYFDNFILSGTDHTANSNQTGPEIELYLNDYGYTSGKVVNETPTLIARISDEDGLNTSGNGIGHDLMLIVDGSASMTYKLNGYYTSDIGSYTSGVVQYVLPELSAGKHHLSFKAWDVQNNSNVDTLLFEVKPGKAPSISNLNYAQKGESAVFIFDHDRPEVHISVDLSVYDLLGRSVWTENRKMQASENVSDTLEWNLTDTNGVRVPNGIYICKVLLTDSNGIQTVGSKKIRVAAQ